MRYQITFNDEATAVLESIRAELSEMSGLHASMAVGVKAAFQKHLDDEGYTGRQNALGGQSSGFWKKVGDSVTTEADESSAVVTITQRGYALRLLGGVVTPSTRKAMSVPVHESALSSAGGINASQYPEPLAFIPASRQFGPFRQGQGQDTVGYLVRGETKTITRGPNKGKTRIVPTPGGEMIYVLRKRTYHEPDSNAMPSDEKLTAAAAAAGEDYLEAIAEERRT